MAKKTFTGAVTTAALLKTFADFFYEPGGDVGRSVATRGGREAGYLGFRAPPIRALTKRHPLTICSTIASSSLQIGSQSPGR